MILEAHYTGSNSNTLCVVNERGGNMDNEPELGLPEGRVSPEQQARANKLAELARLNELGDAPSYEGQGNLPVIST